MRRKAVVFMVTIGMMLGVLGGCGDARNGDTGSGPGQPETGEENAGSGEAQDTGGKSELTLWLPPNGENEEEFWTEKLADFEAENNCEVHLEIIPWQNYEEKYLTGVNSSNGPDVGYMYMEMFYDYIEMGALTDFDSYFTQEEKENYLYYDMGHLVDGQYALPFVVGNARVIYGNMDILNEAGVTKMPETTEEFLEVCKAVKESNPEVYPFIDVWGAANYVVLNGGFWPFLWGAGGAIVDENGNMTLDSEAGLEAVEFLHTLYEEGYLPETVTSCDDSLTPFKNGEAAMFISGTVIPAELEGIRWDYSPVLQGSKAAETFVACDSLVLFESCKNKELAAKLMKYMTSTDVMTAWHKQVVQFPPINKDEEYVGDERFEVMYREYADHFKATPVFKGAGAIYDILYKNLQSMMMGDLTPKEVLEETTDYYNTNIK